jgi:hypothetical protein
MVCSRVWGVVLRVDPQMTRETETTPRMIAPMTL